MSLSQSPAAQRVAHVTPDQRERARQRLALRARILQDEIGETLVGTGLALDAREPETDDVEASVTAAGAERDSDELAAIEGALARIEAGTYGLCASCGAVLPWPRLDAVPEALRCVHCEETREKKRRVPPRL